MIAILEREDVIVEQFVAVELGNSSYVVADPTSGTAAVIDPVRDVDGYLARAQVRRWRIAEVLDTHVHNDFISGAPDLRAAVGARVGAPGDGGIARVDRELHDGDEIPVGSLRLRAIHSAGHTPEHLSYLLVTTQGTELALFSGGALMVGTMARPDLLGPSRTFELAHSGRRTLARLLDLPDGLLVLPTHGGGSFCGAASSDDRTTSVGRERQTNPLAAAPDFAHFLAIHAKQGEYPTYYAQMAPRNRAAEPWLAGRPPEVSRLSAAEIARFRDQGGNVIDCRNARSFDAGHVPGALSVGVDGPFSPWVGWVVSVDDAVALVAESSAAAEEAVRQLIRIGFTSIRGWLPFTDWLAEGLPTHQVERRTMDDVAEQVLDGERITIVDVRQEREWAAGHLPGALHALPSAMAGLAASLDRAAPVAVHCASGYRSGVAVSLLLRAGVTNLWHISENVDAWERLGHPLVALA